MQCAISPTATTACALDMALHIHLCPQLHCLPPCPLTCSSPFQLLVVSHSDPVLVVSCAFSLPLPPSLSIFCKPYRRTNLTCSSQGGFLLLAGELAALFTFPLSPTLSPFSQSVNSQCKACRARPSHVHTSNLHHLPCPHLPLTTRCGLTNGDGTVVWPKDQVTSYADGNPDYPGSCGRCYEVNFCHSSIEAPCSCALL